MKPRWTIRSLLLVISCVVVIFTARSIRYAAVMLPLNHVEGLGGLVLHSWQRPRITRSVGTAHPREIVHFVCLPRAKPKRSWLQVNSDPRTTVEALVIPASSIEKIDVSIIQQLDKLRTIVIHSFIDLPATVTKEMIADAKRFSETATSLENQLGHVDVFSAGLVINDRVEHVGVEKHVYDSWKAVARLTKQHNKEMHRSRKGRDGSLRSVHGITAR